jgi:hypothetical protein
MIRTGAILAGVLGVLCTLGTPSAHADEYERTNGTGRLIGPDGICTDTTTVVGYRRCVPYGVWSRSGPNLFIEFGMQARYLVDPQPARVAARGTGTAQPTSPGPGGVVGLTSVERLGVRLVPALYLAGEFEMGTGVTLSDDRNGGRALLVGGLGVAGLRGVLPFGSVAVELAAGGRVVEESSESLETWNEGVAEVRVRGALWLSPWCTLGVVGGKSLLVRGEWMAGILVTVETYSFGGP